MPIPSIHWASDVQQNKPTIEGTWIEGEEGDKKVSCSYAGLGRGDVPLPVHPMSAATFSHALSDAHHLRSTVSKGCFHTHPSPLLLLTLLAISYAMRKGFMQVWNRSLSSEVSAGIMLGWKEGNPPSPINGVDQIPCFSSIPNHHGHFQTELAKNKFQASPHPNHHSSLLASIL